MKDRVRVRKHGYAIGYDNSAGWLVIRNHRVLAIFATHRRAIRHAQHVAKYGESTW